MVIWVVLCATQSREVCWFDQYRIGCCIVAVMAAVVAVIAAVVAVSAVAVIAAVIAVSAVFHLSASDRQSTKRVWNDGLFTRPVFD